jgi:hypothetical protein
MNTGHLMITLQASTLCLIDLGDCSFSSLALLTVCAMQLQYHGLRLYQSNRKTCSTFTRRSPPSHARLYRLHSRCLSHPSNPPLLSRCPLLTFLHITMIEIRSTSRARLFRCILKAILPLPTLGSQSCCPLRVMTHESGFQGDLLAWGYGWARIVL